MMPNGFLNTPTEVATVSRLGYCSLWRCSNTSWVVRVSVPSRSSLCQRQSANATTHSGSGQQVLSPDGEVNPTYRLRRAAPCTVKEDCCTLHLVAKKKHPQNPLDSPKEGPSAHASAGKFCL